MDLSELIRESERLRPQIADEPDASLQREMKKTYKHYQKQIRSATKHHHPWFGLKLNLLFLVAVLVGLVYLCIRCEMAYGWAYTLSGVIVGAVAIVLLTAMVFLLMRIISPDNYKELVQVCFESLRKLKGIGGNDTNEIPTVQPTTKATPKLPSSVPPFPVPKVSSDNPSIQSISAGDDSKFEDA